MNYEELQSLLTQAEEAINFGSYSESEKLCKEVLTLLSLQTNINDTEVQQLRSLSLRMLAESLARRRMAKEALLVAEEALNYDIQSSNKQEEAAILNIMGNIYPELGLYDKALETFEKALRIYEDLGNQTGTANVKSNIGLIYATLSDFHRALEYYSDAIADHEKLGNTISLARTWNFIGLAYSALQNFPRSLEYYSQALATHEKLSMKSDVARVKGNIGGIYRSLKDYPRALEYYGEALSLHEELGNSASATIMFGSIGNLYSDLADYNLSLEFHKRALAAYKEFGNKRGVALETGNIGTLYAVKKFEGYDPVMAEEFLLKAIAENERLGLKQNLYIQHAALSSLYEQEERWKEFGVHYKKYHELEKEVQSEETIKAANLMEQRRQASEREKEITIAKAVADAEMNATTSLLHKVLPPSIASRLIKGEKIADYFSQISILFADIVGFTPIASKMPARKVLAFLNYVFGEFDRIIEKHGCEKIKTIGDGYMAVAGAPIECSDHAERIARVAMEMMGDIQLPEDIRSSLPKGAIFTIRIGINIGPAFGGIVGENRFVYDIYSDAVNTAARMESHGEPNRIHVSEDFAFHLQNRMDMTNDDLGGVIFEERDEIEIKGKGLMKTYFLEQIK